MGEETRVEPQLSVIPFTLCGEHLDSGEFVRPNVLDLFRQKNVVRTCAPMVRYSKLPFRMLVRKYGCDLCYTPMIVASSFIQSSKARDNEFTTNAGDRPLVVQFAATSAREFADAAQLVAPYADAIDLNCGCPQRWAMAEGFGAKLIKNPELVADMVTQAKESSRLPVSIKIRIHHDLRRTVELVRVAEQAGASWITVHGRTTQQRGEPANMDAIKLVKESIGIPVVANGDIRSEEDVLRVHEYTKVDGVMAARGILANPAMFAGYSRTPHECIQNWVDIAMATNTHQTPFHQHLMYMLSRVTETRADRREFNTLSSVSAIRDYLSVHYGIS